MRGARAIATLMLGLGLGLGLGACGGPPPRPTLADAQRGNVTLAALEDGRAKLLERCSRCHAAPHPTQFPAAAWPREVTEMAERSKLAPMEQKAIELYLMTLAGR